jgi:hypothetical protein
MDHLLALPSFLAAGTLTLAWNHFDSWDGSVAPVCVEYAYPPGT